MQLNLMTYECEVVTNAIACKIDSMLNTAEHWRGPDWWKRYNSLLMLKLTLQQNEA